MKIGLVGLGKMGANMTQRLLNGGHQVVVQDISYERAQELAAKGAQPAKTLDDLVAALSSPRVVWVMVPSGAPTETTIEKLNALLQPGDILIDGGNSNYKDSIRRGNECADQGIHFLDAGTSGGIWGLEIGYCLMVGGNPDAFQVAEPIFKTLAPPDGYALMGPCGSGHFVKMVHNGIEYGMLQAYGEGFEILKASQFPLDLHRIAALWGQGSVIRSWLLELAERAFSHDPDLSDIKGFVEDSGEGRWTVEQAIDTNVPAPIITLSLMERFRSRQPDSFSAKVIAALRNEFGGHAVKKE